MSTRRAYYIAEKICAVVGCIVLCLSIGFAISISWKVPWHNFNLWRLDMNFQTISLHHPTDSKLLLKRRYVGGLYPSGSVSCSYFVGEFRSSALSREEIMRAYDGLTVTSFDRKTELPVEVRFADEGFLDDPWYEWREELLRSLSLSATEEVVYSVVVAHLYHSSYFGDFRCF